MNKTYKIVRFYRDPDKESKIIKRGLTLEEAQAHCKDPATANRYGPWKTWYFDGYEEES